MPFALSSPPRYNYQMAAADPPANLPAPGAAPGALDWAHPIVREWFLERFASPTEPQELGWPHILVTPPESLYILLTAERSRAILRNIETIIVDEIHAVADDKRGAHLALSLERLEALLPRPPVRIGLSATQKPIELIAQFLAGSNRPAPVIVDTRHGRRMDVAVAVALSEPW